MWGKLSLGRDVCNSPQHGLHVNSLLGLSIKLKAEIESALEKRKLRLSASVSIKFQL